VDENLYSIQGDTLAVKTLEGRPIGTVELREGDSILAAARKIVREKGAPWRFLRSVAALYTSDGLGYKSPRSERYDCGGRL
jgi:hypothetical protein